MRSCYLQSIEKVALTCPVDGAHDTVNDLQTTIDDACAFAPNRGDEGTEAKIRFSSAMLPKGSWRTKSLDALLPASSQFP
jgi:hypothetical protein